MSKFHHPQPLTDEQIKVLEDVKPYILKEASRFDIDAVFNICGAPACIAGHCSVLLNIPHSGMSMSLVEEFFGMPLDEDGIAHEMPLFYDGMWDGDIGTDYDDTEDGTIERANVAIQAINRYISNTKAHFAKETDNV